MKETGIYNILGALDNIADKSVQKCVLLEIIPVKNETNWQLADGNVDLS